MQDMSEAYKISFMERVQHLEEELALQLAELKTEIENNGILQGTPNRAYSSVTMPKEISYFRHEREMILNKGLQVAEAKPLIVQADVMQRELESCLRREYAVDNVPLLLHQFYTNRIQQLVRSKYLHMLRWKRFCQHSSTIEQLYPLYQKQVALVMQEYNDALQRAKRLSTARENLLTGQTHSVNLVTLEDLVIYLQWLVCHLHSIRNIHNYLRILQYLPISDKAEQAIEKQSKVAQGSKDTDSHTARSESSASEAYLTARQKTAYLGVSESPGNLPSVPVLSTGPHFTPSVKSSSSVMQSDGFCLNGLVSLLPQHMTETDELKPQLQELLSHFKIGYDVEDLRNTASEMELYTMVASQFRSVFMKQQTMRTFPVYDTGAAVADKWGFSGYTMALKKKANWIPFVKVKPKRDPWQQKLMTKLKQHKKVDELLRIQSEAIKVSSADRVMEALQEHAASVLEPVPVKGVSSHPSHHIWAQIYDSSYVESQRENCDENISVLQGFKVTDSTDFNKRPLSSRKKKETGYSYQTTMQLLGLEESADDGSKDPVMMRGAYLSFLLLRHLRIRELQRVCLGILNYFRSVERTLTISIAGLTLNAGHLVPTIGEEPCWVNAARGGSGTSEGLGSHHYMHHTPADYQVHSAQFMELSEIENHDDFYTLKDGCLHSQDPRGAYIVYDVALRDFKALEKQLLLVASQFIEKDKNLIASRSVSGDLDISAWAHANVDRFAVLLDLWTCEVALLENKQQLLDCYYEAYQHALDPEERFALSQVISDITYRRPRFDFSQSYFVQAYKDECVCLRLHLQLVKEILNKQIDSQREYVQRIWQEERNGGVYEFGLPLNIISKQLISINNSCPALKNIYLLEFHPSLGLACLIPKALEHICQEFQQLCRPQTGSQVTSVEKQVLQLALDEWLNMKLPGSSFNTQVQRDLFADVMIEDPLMLRDIGLYVVESTDDEEQKYGKGKQVFITQTFSKILELITLRHRLMETALEAAQLSRLYRMFAAEMGFEEFHLYLRPVQFEFATNKGQVDILPPTFITAVLEDANSVDRYIPSTLMLGIHEVEESQVGKFSFHTRDGVIQLLSKAGVENLQVALACQVTQKNALLVAVQLASFCGPFQQPSQGNEMKDHHQGTRNQLGTARSEISLWSGKDIDNTLLAKPSPHHVADQPVFGLKKRIPECFVSMQLEKVGLRDMMLNTFIQRKQSMGTVMKNADEVEKVKRKLLIDYCQSFSHRMSHYAIRGQIIANCNSLKALLEDFPTIRNTNFMIGQPQEKRGEKESREGLKADPRIFQERSRCLMSTDGRAVLNLWYIPHPSEVLIMFKTLPERAAFKALSQMLQIVAALRDIVSYILSFAQLGNPSGSSGSQKAQSLMADWGGLEGIGSELRELQRLIDSLPSPQDPKAVAQLLTVRRDVMFMQFDAAVRHLIREAFLSSGNLSAYTSTTENMFHGLPPLSSSVVKSAFASQLPLPQPLDPRKHRTFMLFPWRTFLSDGGLFPVLISNLCNTEYHMQLCLCGLSDQDRTVAHGELVGAQLLMEDVLQNNYESNKLNSEDLEGKETPYLNEKQQTPVETRQLSANQHQNVWKTSEELHGLHNPITAYSLLRSFLKLWKQLELFKDVWGRLKLSVEEINSVALYKQFSELYRVDILYPSLKALARQMGKEDEFEALLTSTQNIHPPKGASEITIRSRQLQRILEGLEIHMIHEVQKKINKEITMVISERAREDRGLPTELWKHPVMKENFSATRPHILEQFVQRLMENCQDSDTEITFGKDHLQRCLTILGCDIMARERSNYETYSMFYENVLQQEHQLLYQKEQELQAIESGQQQVDSSTIQTAELSHELVLEVTALRTKLSDVEEGHISLKERVKKEVQNEYETLVRTLFGICINLKSRLDEYHINMHKQVCELISDVRKECLDNIIDLKMKFGATKDDNTLKENLATHQELQTMRDENSRLEELVCKLKALGTWKETIKQGKLREQLRNVEAESIQNKKDSLKVKMVAEQEVALLREQLRAVQKALVKSQAESEKVKKQLDKQKQLLTETEHRLSQENRSRQHLDHMKAASMEKLLEDIGDKEQRLQSLAEEAEKSSKWNHLQQNKVKKEIRQIRSRLCQERSLKLDAFHRVDELQTQVYDLETATPQRNSSAGMRRKSPSLLSYSAGTSRTHSAGPAMYAALSAYSAPSLLREYQQSSASSELRASGLTDGGTEGRIQRPKTVPSRCRNRTGDLPGATHHTILQQLQELRLNIK
ncbi:uncharacterized protein [Pleurodeles waltl]|uniref:uncharacterized protein n=1 Tax=Pleurodeles waltl TaxID=8319 RepID=UPI0037094284